MSIKPELQTERSGSPGPEAKLVSVLKNAFAVLSAIRLLPLIVVMLAGRNRDITFVDLNRWAEVYHLKAPLNLISRISLFTHLMTWLPEYRNVFYLRSGLPGKLLSIFCRPLSSLYLGRTHIEAGLFILHGDSTFVTAERIGKNCWINQHVVIGHSNETDYPTIGDNVTIFAGAKILGKVTVGDNATIGANSVVIQNVPPNVTVMGVPARIISSKNS
jgi:serine O-acetyltransferase